MSLYVEVFVLLVFFFFKQKTAYEMRISDWSSDVCSSDLLAALRVEVHAPDVLREPRRGQDERDFPGSFRCGLMSFRLEDLLHSRAAACVRREIGRASCRERVCPYV